MIKINSCDGIYEDSLDVRFTKKCDNSCNFCIEKKGINALEENIDKMIISTLKSKKNTILILGGEPFLNIKNLKQYIKGIKDYVKEIYITTSLPNTINLLDKDVCFILDNITCLNVSIQHCDYNQNNLILKSKSNHNRIEQLKNIANVYGYKIRVNLNLVKNNIDNKEKLTEALELFSSFKIKEIKINELQNVNEELYVDYEIITENKMLSPFVFGCQTDITEHWIKNKNITSKILLKRACFYVKPEKFQKASFLDFLKVLIKKFFNNKNNLQKVLYENGNLENNWIEK